MLRLAARLSRIARPDKPRPAKARPRRLIACEALEPRELLSGLGTDYTLMGGQWNNSQTITYSIAPDGVQWGGGVNNVNATLDAQYGGTSWENLIAKALQTWAAATNLNFVEVPDGAYNFNAPGVNEGDPDFGDIRIGGYNFGTTATIAQTYGPPPNGTTGAGDVMLNTGFNFAPGSHYDLESVLIHELGHSLGLGESPQPTAAMYGDYEGIRETLSNYDIEGIQSLYGARSFDGFQSLGLATSPATAADVTPALNAAQSAHLYSLSLQSSGDTEYFSVVAPAEVGATLNVAAIAQGFSLLSPKLTIIDPTTGATLAANANPNAYGDNVAGSVVGVQAGHRYLIEVSGATGDVFSVGSYSLQVGFVGGKSAAPSPDRYPYNQPFALATDLGTNTQPTMFNLTLPSAQNYQLFSFETTQSGPVLIGAFGVNAVVINAIGQQVESGSGTLGFVAPGAGKYYVVMLSPNGAAVNNYAMAVRTTFRSPAIVAKAVSPPSVAPALATSAASTPLATTVEVASESSPVKTLVRPAQ
jgi:hypothetical protein